MQATEALRAFTTQTPGWRRAQEQNVGGLDLMAFIIQVERKRPILALAESRMAYQLLGAPNCTLLRPQGGPVQAAAAEADLKVPLTLIPALLALTGCHTVRAPGIKGIGNAYAAQLIRALPDLRQ